MYTIEVQRALIAATVYFLTLFALGFVFGTLRIFILQPYLGQLAATLCEVPVMVFAAWVISLAAIRHWHVGSAMVLRITMAVWFLALLALFETVMGALLFGRTLAQQWMALTTLAGAIGLSAQIGAALLLLVVRQDRLSQAHVPPPAVHKDTQ